jgi:ABC-type branched-subunit amino acid transport system substrate-binding protein/ABC-type amino acid transport substrate-binding protein
MYMTESFLIILLAGTVASKEVIVGVLLPTIDVDDNRFDQPARAIRLAFDEIKKNPNILPDTQVRLVVNITGYDRWQTITAALWQVNVAGVTCIVGGADVSAVRVISPIANAGGVPFISPSPTQYDPDSEILYPTFIAIQQTNDRLNVALKAIIDQFGWRKIAFIHSDDDYGINGIRYAIDIAITQGYHITSVYLEEPHGPHLADSEIEDILKLKEDNLRIFVLVLHPSEQAAVLRLASESGMFEVGYAWIIVHCNYGTDLFLKGRMDGIICIRQKIDDTKSNELFERIQESEYRGNESSMWIASVYAYNAAKRIVQALQSLSQNETEEKQPVSGNLSCYSDYWSVAAARKKLLKALKTESFTDIGGFSHLNDTSQEMQYEYVNYHNGQFDLFATYRQEFSLVSADSNTQRVLFPGNKTIVPLDIPTKHSDTLRILVPRSPPMADYVSKTTGKACDQLQNHQDCEFTGIGIELINNITAAIGLDAKYVLWTGHWKELIRQIEDESTDWDLTAEVTAVTSLRSKQVTFSSSIYDSGLKILIKTTKQDPPLGQSMLLPIKPFSTCLWLLLIGVVTLAVFLGCFAGNEVINFPALMYFFFLPARLNKQRRPAKSREQSPFKLCGKLSLKLLFVFCIAMLLFLFMIMLSVYTSNLSVHLYNQHNTPPTPDFRDLSGSKYTVGCRPGTPDCDYVQNELSVKDPYPVEDGHHAVELLKNGTIDAYVADTVHLSYLAAANSNVMVVGQLEQHQKYAFPMKLSLPYANQINRIILEAVEKGYVFGALHERLINTQVEHSTEPKTSPQPLTLNDFRGLFLLVGVAGGIIIIIFGGCLKLLKRLKCLEWLKRCIKQEK